MNIDPIKSMLSRTDTLDDPNVMREDDPPMLRFERGTLEDRFKTEETGNYGYKDAVFVYVRALGDIKTEVPYVVETTVQVPSFEEVIIVKKVPVLVETVQTDGSILEEEKYREREVREKRATFTTETVTPWLDQVDERLRKGVISQDYRDFCHRSYAKWKETGSIPIDGTPVVEWRMISPAQCQTLLDMDINTIEKVADMTEDALAQFGMGGQTVKKKAKEFLKAGKEPAKQTAEILKLKKDTQQLQDNEKDYLAKIKELEDMIEDQTKPES